MLPVRLRWATALGEVHKMGLTDKAIEAGVDAAIKAREERDKRRKITDEATLRILLKVECVVENVKFAPPLDVYVNGVRKAEGVNMDADAPENERGLWETVGVDADGVRPVTIRLKPVAGADVYFKEGTSPSMRLEPSFYRNEVEKAGKDFKDPGLREADTKPHVVRVEIKPRRGGLFRSRKADDIPKKWRYTNRSEGHRNNLGNP